MPEIEVDQLKSYFQSKHAHVSTYWLQCCVDWFKRSINNYTQKSMCEQIFEQWLLADFRDIEETCLPPGLFKEKKFSLNGNYILQLMYLKDISRSSYSQLQKIRDMYKLTRSVTDTENEPVGKRVLYLTVTDGVQEIKAFEHETIACLNFNLSPGVKLLLTGPLLVRNGEILLQNSNVKILGGEVEELLVPNAVENVLARELNLPENPNPGKLNTDPLENIADMNTVNEIQNVGVNYNNTSSNQRNNTNANNFNECHQRSNRNPNNCNNSNQRNNRNANVINSFNQPSNRYVNNVIVIDSDDDYIAREEENLVNDENDDMDDIFNNIDIDAQLDQIEQNASFHENSQDTVNDEEFLNIDVSNLGKNRVLNSGQSTSNINDSELLNVNVSNFQDNTIATFSKSTQNVPSCKSDSNSKQSKSYSNDSEFFNINFSNFEDSTSNTSRQSAPNSQTSFNACNNVLVEDNEPKQKRLSNVETNSEPFVYIKQLLDNKDHITANKKFQLKAQFLRVIGKLTVKKSRGWAMQFEITDGTGKMVVDFASDVIEGLIGISAAEAVAEKNNIKNKRMVTFEKITEALNNCKKKLLAFNGIMTLQLSENNSSATITKLEHITNEHLQQLKRRVESASVLKF